MQGEATAAPVTIKQSGKAKAEQPRRPVPADHRSPPEPAAAATLPPPRRSTFPCVPRAATSSALRRRHAADWPPAAPPLSPPPPPAPLPGSPLSGPPPARQLAPAFSRPPPVPPRGEAPPVRRLLAAVGRSCFCWLRVESAVCVCVLSLVQHSSLAVHCSLLAAPGSAPCFPVPFLLLLNAAPCLPCASR